ncbi:disulfide bond formation protein B [Rhodovulum sulfidophilum]|uniref:disulfide bond formation protein B n=1 Tax=Rhodovulum sulfidophilum TaxID=35806 RepID=UPI0009524FCB|nr:disulfide bond formation protein B [Rhodovulum sulfidophilum]MBL3553628.1 disulfide bond formation protein B [Rhodovulum sulfidophilum]OLS48615.1 disulfide bond formation protein B [Rhodovulum sulfidophilum]
MTATRNQLILLAAGASAATLLAGFGFEHLGGLAPCKLCLWQRWPHAVAPILGLLAVAIGGRMLPLSGMVTMAVSTGLAIYHSGVERHWWAGPSSCTGSGPSLSQMTPEQILTPSLVEPVVLCDRIAWELFGLTMANYNVLLSAFLVVVWAMALARGRG